MDRLHDISAGEEPAAADFTKYDRRAISYASTFNDPWKAAFIRMVENVTGRVRILRLVREFERRGAPQGQAFWRAALDVMGIDLLTPQEQLDRIPKTGPLIVVANHPHGMVDGMIFADLIGRVRPDYRILTRSLLTVIDEVAGSYMIPVPFPHDPDAQRKGVAMRAHAMKHLQEGGVVALFPSGGVAASETYFGPAVDVSGPELPRVSDRQQALPDVAAGALVARDRAFPEQAASPHCRPSCARTGDFVPSG